MYQNSIVLNYVLDVVLHALCHLSTIYNVWDLQRNQDKLKGCTVLRFQALGRWANSDCRQAYGWTLTCEINIICQMPANNNTVLSPLHTL